MRFSIDAHAIGQHLTGNETYIRNLIANFAVVDGDSEFVAYVSRESAVRAIPRKFTTRFVADNPFVRLGFDLSRKVRQDRPKLLHVQYTAPLFCPVPVVASVHDISFLSHAQYFTRFRAMQLRWTVKRTIRTAAKVLTPSEFSKRCIVDVYGVDEGKVSVVPNAVSSDFRPVRREAARRWIEAHTGIRAPYVLSIGDLQPRKNHLGLIRAFEELVNAHPQLPHHLVLVGKETWYAREIREAAHRSSVAERIVFTGFVPDDELLRYYAGCDLFVYPSFYEGFGLPILEAMACGRAVACSNTTAMPEVADSCALLFDPCSISEMVRAMRDLLVDAELRTRMERLGIHRAAQFSWERTARKTLESYYEVAGCTPSVPVPEPVAAFHA